MKLKIYLLSFSCFLSISNSFSQSTLWATAWIGGLNYTGTLLQADSSGSNFHKVYSFISSTGKAPLGNLVYANNNKIYGVTYLGGPNGGGSGIFEYDPSNGNYNYIHDFFSYQQFGWGAISGMVVGPNGLLYGLAPNGGAFNGGALYSIDPVTHAYADIYDFDTLVGSNCHGVLLHDNGTLLGLSIIGGNYGLGTLFSFDPVANSMIKLYDFDSISGFNVDNGGLIKGTNGKFYGAFYFGGLHNNGTIFSFDLSNNTFVKIHDFDSINGNHPVGKLIEAPDGLLYGVTRYGGLYNNGILFSLDKTGNSFNTLFSFNGINGEKPIRGLTLTNNGIILGNTINGGLNGMGIIFKYDPVNNVFTKLLDFDNVNGNSGSQPNGEILEIPFNPVAIQNLIDQSTFDVYPNPATDLLILKTKTMKPLTLLIYDVLGQERVSATITGDARIDVSKFAQGVYFYRVNDGYKILKTGKILKV